VRNVVLTLRCCQFSSIIERVVCHSITIANTSDSEHSAKIYKILFFLYTYRYLSRIKTLLTNVYKCSYNSVKYNNRLHSFKIR
jgi:hypothetical protein